MIQNENDECITMEQSQVNELLSQFDTLLENFCMQECVSQDEVLRVLKMRIQVMQD